MADRSSSTQGKKDFSELIVAGKEIRTKIASLADKWSPNGEKGPPSLWTSGDEYFLWFKGCRQKVEETFGANSKELRSWDEDTKGGQPKYPSLVDPGYKPPPEPQNPHIPYLDRVSSTLVLLASFDGPVGETETSTLVDGWIARIKNNRVIAVLIVIGIVLSAVMGFWKELPEPITHYMEHLFRPPLALPGDTGWIFVGYYNEPTGAFIEGPKVEIINSTMRARNFYVELGDTIRLKNVTKVYMVDYAPDRSTTKKLVSPIEKGVLSSSDETGVALPAGTELIVRDVSRGAWPGNPNTAIWVRVVFAAGNGGP